MSKTAVDTLRTHSIVSIPQDVLTIALEFLSDESVCALIRCCRSLRLSAAVDEVWRSRFARAFPGLNTQPVDVALGSFWYTAFATAKSGVRSLTILTDLCEPLRVGVTSRDDAYNVYSAVSSAFAAKTGFSCESYTLIPRGSSEPIVLRSDFHTVGVILKEWGVLLKKAVTSHRSHQVERHHNRPVDAMKRWRLYHDETYELRWLPRPSSSRAEVRSAWSRVVQPQEQHPDNQTDDVRRFAQVLGQWRDAVRPSLGNRGWKAAGLGVKTHPLLSLCMDPSLRLSLSTRRQALTAFTADTVKALGDPKLVLAWLQRCFVTVGSPHLLFTIASVVLSTARSRFGLLSLLMHAIDAPSDQLWRTILIVALRIIRLHAPIMSLLALDSMFHTVVSHTFLCESFTRVASSAASVAVFAMGTQALSMCRRSSSPILPSAIMRTAASAVAWRAFVMLFGLRASATAVTSTYAAVFTALGLVLKLRWHSACDNQL